MRLIIKVIHNVFRVLSIGTLSLSPLFVIVATPFVQGFPKITKPEWIPWISFIFIFVALNLLSIPFLIISSAKKNPKEYKSMGLYSPRIWYLSFGVCGSACVALGALMMVGFIGNSFYWAYTWAGISFSMELYWYGRYLVYLREQRL